MAIFRRTKIDHLGELKRLWWNLWNYLKCLV